MRLTCLLLLALAAACRAEDAGTVDLPADQPANPARSDEAPVPLDADSPVEYPASLYDQGIGGTVVLHLFVTAEGVVVPESTRVQESSGYPALDSAALASAPRLRYAPALREGQPVAAPFTQPIIFRPPPREGVVP